MANNAPIETKVSVGAAATYVGSTGVLAALTAVADHHELVGWMPGAVSPFVLALIPTAISFVAAWCAKHSPRLPSAR